MIGTPFILWMFIGRAPFVGGNDPPGCTPAPMTVTYSTLTDCSAGIDAHMNNTVRMAPHLMACIPYGVAKYP